MTDAPVRLIAWDYDGVLNRNIRDGRFVWADDLHADFGLDRDHLEDYLFLSGRFDVVLVGERDIADLVAEYLGHVRSPHPADTLLTYWYDRDVFPCPDFAALTEAATVRQVIATNNEARRADHIWHKQGWHARMERIFAAGPMRAMKPDPAFFAQITDWSGLDPSEIVLVDDAARNIRAARELGWHAIHVTDATRADVGPALQRLGAL